MSRRALIALVGLGAALIVAVPTALAIHDFTDVPNASPFHDDISAVKTAGITAGKTCVPPGTPPTYCPTEGITREAMAAFVHRGFGRVAGDEDGNFSLDGGGPVDLAVITISVGGVGGQTQFVKLDGAVGAFSPSPPDDVIYVISQDGVGPVTFSSGFSLPTAGPSGIAIGSGAISKVIGVASGTTQTFRLRAADFANTGGISAWGQLTAVSAPFGSTGTNTLSVGPASQKGGGLTRKK